jgi:hypothetical protein
LSLSASLAHCYGDEALKQIELNSKIENVQPMTGIVLWSSNEAIETAPIQLEYSYLTYRDVMKSPVQYDWSKVEELLSEAASRKHQMILRWHDTYVGQKTGVPEFIAKSPEYKIIVGKSEGKSTEFPDWSYQPLQDSVLEFFTEFGKRYDRDPRLAFVQVGFGLWAEYHIYDGPMEMGKTFPSMEYQTKFLKHVGQSLKQTPWMISVDAANNEWSPIEDNRTVQDLRFGMFDDSFNHKDHEKQNVPNWKILGFDRWHFAPMGGEFAFFNRNEQRLALAPKGPYGTSFETHAARFHVTFMIGDAQPQYQKPDRIKAAGRSIGYAFRIVRFESDDNKSIVEIENIGIAPMYHDAFPSVNGTRAADSLKGLLPTQRKTFKINAGSSQPDLNIESDRLVDGQKIEFEAELDSSR